MNNVRRSGAYAMHGIHLGERLESYRLALGYTKNEMAAYVGAYRNHYPSYENGNMLPCIETLVRMARKLQCTTDHLLGLE